MRVFAGPNGSGKSTIIDAIRNHTENGLPIDFGIYINADDIAKSLRENKFTFHTYTIKATNGDFVLITKSSGLLQGTFNEQKFKGSYEFSNNQILLKDRKADEHLAQILAYYIRERLLAEKKKFSFETVFSHESKLDIMRRAVAAGYKVYLYFVATEGPEINISRVEARVAKGGHNVPHDKIEKRYYKSLELLYDAAQIAYQAFFFDNSGNEKFSLIAHFKKIKNKKKWDKSDKMKDTHWFVKYYSRKVKKSSHN